MSPFLGLVHFDGRPASPTTLRSILSAATGSGSVRVEVVVEGPVGLARMVPGTPSETRPPDTEPGPPWVVADARIDGRADLERELGTEAPGEADDSELIRRAFTAWGTGCVEHLLGDFAFGIWDGERLFLARDHLGVKPLYTLTLDHGLAFSSDLEVLKAHPSFTGELDDLGIADFLLDGFGRDATSTVFTQVRRLPPAHTLEVSRDGCRSPTRRYWALKTPKTRFFDRREGLEQFRSLLRTCVLDRLRGGDGGVGIIMSGGLDSTSVAVTARHLIETRAMNVELHATTLIAPDDPEEEAHFAGLVARSAGMRHELYPVSATESWERDCFRWIPPEPRDLSFQPLSSLLAQPNLGYRVALTGQGGDPALAPALGHFLRLAAKGRLLRIAGELARHRLGFGSWPRFHLRVALGQRRHQARRPPTLPPWFPREWAAELPWPERWADDLISIDPGRSDRAEAHGYLTSLVWPMLFEDFAALGTERGISVRHPYFDVRMLSFLTSLPGSPWCEDKYILREAMRGSLPEAVRTRPKTPVIGFAGHERLVAKGVEWVRGMPRPPELERFVDVARLEQLAGQPERMRPEEDGLVTRPLSLAVWLDSQ